MPKTDVHNKSALYLIYVGKLSKQRPSQLSNDLTKRNIQRKIEKLRTVFVIVSFHCQRVAYRTPTAAALFRPKQTQSQTYTIHKSLTNQKAVSEETYPTGLR